MAEETKELEFPLIFDGVCPACGSEEWVAEIVKEEETKKGKIRPNALIALGQLGAPIFDNTKLDVTLVAPLLTAILDICRRCGMVRAKRVDKHMIPKETILQMMAIPIPGGDKILPGTLPMNPKQ